MNLSVDLARRRQDHPMALGQSAPSDLLDHYARVATSTWSARGCAGAAGPDRDGGRPADRSGPVPARPREDDPPKRPPRADALHQGRRSGATDPQAARSLVLRLAAPRSVRRPARCVVGTTWEQLPENGSSSHKPPRCGKRSYAGASCLLGTPNQALPIRVWRGGSE